MTPSKRQANRLVTLEGAMVYTPACLATRSHGADNVDFIIVQTAAEATATFAPVSAASVNITGTRWKTLDVLRRESL